MGKSEEAQTDTKGAVKKDQSSKNPTTDILRKQEEVKYRILNHVTTLHHIFKINCRLYKT